jgi:hypothetical protein
VITPKCPIHKHPYLRFSFLTSLCAGVFFFKIFCAGSGCKEKYSVNKKHALTCSKIYVVDWVPMVITEAPKKKKGITRKNPPALLARPTHGNI